MGRAVQRVATTRYKDKITLAAQVDPEQNAPDSVEKLFECDVVIDFSSSLAMAALATLALKSDKHFPVFVVGSTGWKLDDRRSLEELAKKTPVLMSSNFSIGVLAVMDAIRHLSPVLERLKFDAVIIETHHKTKKDAPSGTAISLQRAISPSGAGNIPVHSIRAGEVIGDHEVYFHGHAEQIVIKHTAHDRGVFAEGAIEVGLWLHEKKSGPRPGQLLGIETFFADFRGKK